MPQHRTPNQNIPDWAMSLSYGLLGSLRERDLYTFGHCLRVARNVGLLAQAAGFQGGFLDRIELAGAFHDLGKIGIPDAVLLKPTRLSLAEQEIMKAHPVKSVQILKPLEHLLFFSEMFPGILHHHERMDGKGYPLGLVGEEIPLEARMILICDTFDAMTSNRPYRMGMPVEKAYQELKRFAGRQFDPHLVKIFLKAHPKWKQKHTDVSEYFLWSTFGKSFLELHSGTSFKLKKESY